MQVEQDSGKLLDQEKTGNGPKVASKDHKGAFQHRCALEHSPHYINQQSKARRACNKLVLVSIVSFVFCGVEAVGGTLSGSLAILCDAAHQLSDVAGFVISFLAIYLTRKPATMKNTYGYHRADVIGALGSIIIIWGLLIWLLSEAVRRILNPEEIDGTIMLATAIFGLGCNLLNLFVLVCCCNSKGEGNEKVHLLESIASAYKPFHGNQITREIKSIKAQSRKGSMLSKKSSMLQQFDADDENQAPLKMNADPTTAEKTNSTLIKQNEQTENLMLSQSVEQVEEDSPASVVANIGASMDASKRTDHSPTTQKRAPSMDEIKEERAQSSNKISVVEVQSVRSEDENINIRAAIVHMVGDMIQSLGVIIAAVIIYVKPDWTIADPICTFLFSILVMFTTVPIFKDCMRYLMENAPADIDPEEVYESIQELDVVKEIHDFHLWGLSDDKPIFTAHVVCKGNPSYALFLITELLQREYEIYHSTIQIEPEKANHQLGLTRCVNEFNFAQDNLK